MTSLEATAARDAAATGGAEAANAKRNADRMFAHFVAGMREVTKTAC